MTVGSSTKLNWNFQSAETSNEPNLLSAAAALPLVGGNVTSFRTAVKKALKKVLVDPPAR